MEVFIVGDVINMASWELQIQNKLTKKYQYSSIEMLYWGQTKKKSNDNYNSL